MKRTDKKRSKRSRFKNKRRVTRKGTKRRIVTPKRRRRRVVTRYYYVPVPIYEKQATPPPTPQAPHYGGHGAGFHFHPGEVYEYPWKFTYDDTYRP